MIGVIRSYLREKGYGFINGDDGKDYFFRGNSFESAEQQLLCDGIQVEFEQIASPKGYSATKCRLVTPTRIDTYLAPVEFATSKTKSFRDWEILEEGNWLVHGSSRDSPDAAKADAIHKAELIDANALVELRYYKTTGSESAKGGRGTYRFTIHNYAGRPVTVGRKSSTGSLKVADLPGIDDSASYLKASLKRKTATSKTRAKYKWMWVGLAALASVIAFRLAGVFAAGVLILGASQVARAENHDKWLERSEAN